LIVINFKNIKTERVKIYYYFYKDTHLALMIIHTLTMRAMDVPLSCLMQHHFSWTFVDTFGFDSVKELFFRYLFYSVKDT